MGRVIRAERVGARVVRAEVSDARRDAQQIEELARLEARRIAEDARAHADRILAEARAEGESLRDAAIAEGNAIGRAEATKQLVDFARLRGDTLRKAEQQALQAVLLVAAQLLGETLRAEPSQITRLLEPHLTRLRRAETLILHLHPDDAAWLERHPRALEGVGLEGSIELRTDPAIARGGCLVESNLGELDARIETRVAELARALGLEEPNQ
ncbi:MAG TPA: FliH/SctL family protein [Polyangiales bacterium]|nr:FliH/SctL family protein [Polyangiales bacterium]